MYTYICIYTYTTYIYFLRSIIYIYIQLGLELSSTEYSLIPAW